MRQALSGRVFYTVIIPATIIALVAFTYRLVFMPPRTGESSMKNEKPAATQHAEKQEDSPPLPNINVKKPEISHIVDGQVAWTVGADSIESDPEAGRTRLLNSIGIFVREGDRGLEFTSPLTVYDAKSKNVRVEGGIKGKLVPEDHALTAAGLSWDEKTGTVVVSDVKVEMNGADLRSGRMELRTDDEKVLFSGGVRITIPVERKGRRVDAGM